MNAKRLFEDDDSLFGDLPDEDRSSHVEIRIDAPETQREIAAVANYLQRVPQIAVSNAELTLLPLDHREGFLLSRVDGMSTIEMILDVCAMPSDEGLELLASLVERGILMV